MPNGRNQHNWPATTSNASLANHGGDISRFIQNGGLGRHEKAILDQVRRDELAIIAQKHKTKLGINAAREMHSHGIENYEEGVCHMSEVKNRHHPRDVQPLVDQFYENSARELGQDIHGIIRLGVENVAEEVNRSTHVEPPEPGILRKIFG